MSSSSFPGVYARIVDNSDIPTLTSRFTYAVLGPTERGPFNQIVRVTSLRDYRTKFGGAVSGSFVPTSIQLAAAQSDGGNVVRVGRQFTVLSTDGTGTADATLLGTQFANNTVSVNDYLRLRQRGKNTTFTRATAVTALNVSLSTGLADTYTAAQISYSPVANAASEAEGALFSYVYDSAVNNTTAAGDKGEFEVELTTDLSDTELLDNSVFEIGDICMISETDKISTREVRIKQIVPSKPGVLPKLVFERTNQSESGHQALPLQDSYTAATIQLVAKSGDTYTTARCADIKANTAGTWANSDGRSGVVVRVTPAPIAGRKNIVVYHNNTVVETIKNCVFDDPEDPSYVDTLINGRSSYITYDQIISDPPANTMDGWNSGNNKVNAAALTNGYNGENAGDSDYIGSYDEASDTYTGLQIFTDPNEAEVDVIYCPGNTSAAVIQEGARIASLTNSMFFLDIPKDLNSREAVDWHNATGLYTGGGTRVANRNAACFWNWFSIIDTFNSTVRFVPPGLGALRATAYTFDSFKPWFAAAGDNRGQIPEAGEVQFKRIIDPDGMYGNGNAVNPIIFYRNAIEVYGNRTLQRTETKLTELHNVFLVNYIVRNMARLGRQFVFDPNDDILLSQLRGVYTQFLQSVQRERGIEAFRLTVDASNNTPATRNARKVIVDFAIIPTSTAEQILINATIMASGAEIKEISTTT